MELPPTIKDSVGKIQQRLSAAGASTLRFYRANTTLTLSAFTIFSVLLILWARLGFTFEVNRFFAAPVHIPSVLTVQCGATQNVLTWTLPEGHSSNSILKNTDGADGVWVCGGPSNIAPCSNQNLTTYTDTNVQPGHTYDYRHKAWADVASNMVTCASTVATPTPTLPPTPSISVTPFVTPTPSSTPTPSVGGSPAPSTSPTPITSTTPTPSVSTTPTPTASPSGTPTPSVTVTSSPTATPIVQGVLAMGIEGRNASTAGTVSSPVQIRTGQQIEIIIRVRNSSLAAGLTGLVAKALLPAGLVYVNGTTTIGGAASTLNTIAGTGLELGAIGPGQEILLTLRATANATQFAVGTTQLQVVSQVQATAVQGVSAALSVVVTKATSGSVATTQTGPGDALLAAFLISSIITLLYVSYTHTSTYKRREIGSISEQRDPLDFRS